MQSSPPGQIVILNGTPRSGKSSIATAVQNNLDGVWLNLGVDAFKAATPERYQPGIGLRPGGERPDLEPLVVLLYRAMYESIAAHSQAGVNVVVDVGHHDHYSTPRAILPACARVLAGLPVLFVGVRCPLDVVMERRIATWGDSYPVGDPVKLWQDAVHEGHDYDLELDTSLRTPEESADLIRHHLASGPPPAAFQRLAGQQ